MKKILILLMVIVAAAFVFTGCTLDKPAEKNMDEETTTSDEQNTNDETMEKDNDNMEAEDSKDMMEENFLNVSMMDIYGNEWNLAKLDQKAVVKVWASWCSICLSGLDELNEFAGEYEDAVVVTVVSPGMLGEKDKDDFIAWFKSLDGVENIVVILDEDGLLINELGIRGFPTYVYINSEGFVDSQAIGHQATTAVITKIESID